MMDNLNGRIGLDAGIVEQLDNRLNDEDTRLGFACLTALGLLHELYHLQGLEEAEALNKLLDFYEIIQVKNPQAVVALHKLLRTTFLDSDNLFDLFLRDATDSRKAKVDLREPSEAKNLWRERRIAWLLNRTLIDSPVNLEEVRGVLDNPAYDKDGQAQALLAGPFTRQAYDTRVEQANARRIRDSMLEQGKSLTVSRYSRASYFLAMLASASKFLLNLQEMETLCRGLPKEVEEEFKKMQEISNGIGHINEINFNAF